MTDLPDVFRLVRLAQGDSGDAARIAQMLLSLWDGQRWHCDLQSTLYLDHEIFRELLHLWSYLHCENKQLDQLLAQEDIDSVIAAWGGQFAQERIFG